MNTKPEDTNLHGIPRYRLSDEEYQQEMQKRWERQLEQRPWDRWGGEHIIFTYADK